MTISKFQAAGDRLDAYLTELIHNHGYNVSSAIAPMRQLSDHYLATTSVGYRTPEAARALADYARRVLRRNDLGHGWQNEFEARLAAVLTGVQLGKRRR